MSFLSRIFKRSPPKPETKFDRASESLEGVAARLEAEAGRLSKEAASGFGQVVPSAVAPAEDLFAAGDEVAQGTFDAGHGLSETVRFAGHAAAGGGYLAAGVAMRGVEVAAEGAAVAVLNIAKGFAKIASVFGHLLGGDKSITVVELQRNPGAKRLSETLLARSSQEFQKAGAHVSTALAAYAEALRHAVASGADLALAARGALEISSRLAEAAKDGAAGAVLELAATGARVASAAVQVSEAGTRELAELVLLSARASAAVSRALAEPDQAKVEVLVAEESRAIKAQILKIASENKGFEPAAKSILRAG